MREPEPPLSRTHTPQKRETKIFRGLRGLGFRVLGFRVSGL